MSNIIDLTPLLAARPQIEEMTVIVLAETINGAFAEYCEAPDGDAFTEVMVEIGEKLPGEIVDFEELKERYWWACAHRYAFNNGIELIDHKFCRSFNPFRHHVPTLQWARTFLDTLPSRYLDFLKGCADA